MNKFNISLVPAIKVKVIKDAIDGNNPILLVGDTGVGKTSLIRYLAEENKHIFKRINLNGATGVEELLGKFVFESGETRWVYGSLIEAMQQGQWLLVDEINASSPEVLFTLHQLLDDDRKITLKEHKGEEIVPSPEFRFFAAMNPNYSGTKELNKALLSRFPCVVEFDFPTHQAEAKIIEIHSQFNDAEKMKAYLALADNLRFAYKTGLINFICSPRELISFCSLLVKGFSEREAFEYAILNKCDNDERHSVSIIAKLYLDIGDIKIEGKTLLGDNMKLKEVNAELEKKTAEYEVFNRIMKKNKKILDQIIKDKNTSAFSKFIKDCVSDLLGTKYATPLIISTKFQSEEMGFTPVPKKDKKIEKI